MSRLHALRYSVKELVSKNKERLIGDGFNLDLTYIIKDRIIAMGFPAEKFESVYRNDIDDVARFLRQYHDGHYRIYNLCSEKTYNTDKFPGADVCCYPFDDHQAPKLDQMEPFCRDVHEWLCTDKQNVAAIHCKAGKGRTGVMTCAYLVYSGQFPVADEALDFYASKRTRDGKGVTIPSQRRYVNYFAHLLRLQKSDPPIHYHPVKLLLTEILLTDVPKIGLESCVLEFKLYYHKNGVRLMHSSYSRTGRHGDHLVKWDMPESWKELEGDLLVVFYARPRLMKKVKLFQFWFNTFFIKYPVSGSSLLGTGPNRDSLVLILEKFELDKACKDKRAKIFSEDFAIHLLFSSGSSDNSVRLRSSQALHRQISEQRRMSLIQSKQILTTKLAKSPFGSPRQSFSANPDSLLSKNRLSSCNTIVSSKSEDSIDGLNIKISKFNRQRANTIDSSPEPSSNGPIIRQSSSSHFGMDSSVSVSDSQYKNIMTTVYIPSPQTQGQGKETKPPLAENENFLLSPSSPSSNMSTGISPGDIALTLLERPSSTDSAQKPTLPDTDRMNLFRSFSESSYSIVSHARSSTSAESFGVGLVPSSYPPGFRAESTSSVAASGDSASLCASDEDTDAEDEFWGQEICRSRIRSSARAINKTLTYRSISDSQSIHSGLNLRLTQTNSTNV